jgi:septin family protein
MLTSFWGSENPPEKKQRRRRQRNFIALVEAETDKKIDFTFLTKILITTKLEIRRL